MNKAKMKHEMMKKMLHPDPNKSSHKFEQEFLKVQLSLGGFGNS